MDKKQALEEVKYSGTMALGDLPDKFKTDKDIVLEAVKQYEGALQYVGD